MMEQFYTEAQIRAVYDEFDRVFGVDTSSMSIKIAYLPGGYVACCWYKKFHASKRQLLLVPGGFEVNLPA